MNKELFEISIFVLSLLLIADILFKIIEISYSHKEPSKVNSWLMLIFPYSMLLKNLGITGEFIGKWFKIFFSNLKKLPLK